MGASSLANIGSISICDNRFSQNVPFAGGMWLWDSPWVSPQNSRPNVNWGGNWRTDNNQWCLLNRTLGPLIVWGAMFNNFTRIGADQFPQYRLLSKNGEHSSAVVDQGWCKPARDDG